MTSASEEKCRSFQLLSQSWELMVVCRFQIRIIGCVIKTLEVQVGQFLVGSKCPVSQGFVVQLQDHLGYVPEAFVVQNVFQLHQQR